ncbi:hypothetical protein MPL3365_170164 [Mesorhizobium plurifarium]|uniref:Uncharacterized protein n=1 Tax=Mesorhizobium plurifarium TaxID=69974 RepID=A0A090FZA3_MESPL|nr:hypothetical protein MPL3365_170164 [Mesorhizobium plurifarium]
MTRHYRNNRTKSYGLRDKMLLAEALGVERLIQTALREFAHAIAYQTSDRPPNAWLAAQIQIGIARGSQKSKHLSVASP